MKETHEPLPPHLRRKKTVSESAGSRQEHAVLEKDGEHQSEQKRSEGLGRHAGHHGTANKP